MTTAERQSSTADDIPVDDLMIALSDLEILDTLGVSEDDLLLARRDSDLLETLKITYEFLAALRDARTLDTFFQLPKADQAGFLRRIGMTDDPELRRKRTRTFISALEESALAGNGVVRVRSKRRS